LENFMSKSP